MEHNIIRDKNGVEYKAVKEDASVYVCGGCAFYYDGSDCESLNPPCNSSERNDEQPVIYKEHYRPKSSESQVVRVNL